MKNRIRLIIVMLLFLGLASVVSPTCMIPANPSQQSSVPIQQHVLSEAEEFVYCIDEPGTHYVDPALTPRTDYGYHENYDGGGLHTAAGYTILTEYQWLTNDYLDLTYHIQNIPEGYEDYALQIYMSAWENPENLGVWVDTDLSGTPSDLGEISSVGLFSYEFGPWFGSDIYVSLIGAVGLGLPVTKWHITYLRLHCHGVASDPKSVTCDAIFDTDNIYAYHGAGTNTYADFCCTVYDADGYDSVRSVQMSLLTAGSSLIWLVNWDSSSGFSITYGSASIALDSGSYFTHSGLYRKVIHFYVIIKWAHSDYSDTKVELGANYKVESETYDYGWDIRTELAFFGLPQLETPRCDPSASVDFTGRLKYADSNTHLAPLSNGVDIVPKRTSPSSWTGSTYGVDSSGYFAAACDATSSLGDNDFTLHVYGEGIVVELLTATDTVRVSEIIAYNEGCNDDLINVGTDATTIYTYLRYDDGSLILGAVSCTWSGITLTHTGSGQWTGTSNSQSTPGTTSYTHLIIQTIHGVSYV